jgi:hypothetical protein
MIPLYVYSILNTNDEKQFFGLINGIDLLFSINPNGNDQAFSSVSSTKMIALEGQFLSQVPHSTQILTSIYDCVSPSVIASTSHPVTQAPHKIHSLVTT